MPIHHSVWRVAKSPSRLLETNLPSKQFLEDMIVAAPEVLSDQWMIIGRQENTGFGGRIDLLAMAPDGTLILIELKRDRTPRHVVAQASFQTEKSLLRVCGFACAPLRDMCPGDFGVVLERQNVTRA